MSDARRKKPVKKEDVFPIEPEEKKKEDPFLNITSNKQHSLDFVDRAEQNTPDMPPPEDAPKIINPENGPKKNTKKWYVVRVQSGREDRVQSNIEKRIRDLGLEEQISKVLVPKELLIEIKKGSKRSTRHKLYPGYVIIEMNMTEELLYTLRSIPGVGEIAGEMSESETERLLLACDHGQDKPKPKVAFQKGQNIKVKEGPFESCDGIVDEVNEQRGIIKVRIEIFGRLTPVEFGYWQVESV